jgi:hypothetical protein
LVDDDERRFGGGDGVNVGEDRERINGEDTAARDAFDDERTGDVSLFLLVVSPSLLMISLVASASSGMVSLSGTSIIKDKN